MSSLRAALLEDYEKQFGALEGQPRALLQAKWRQFVSLFVFDVLLCHVVIGNRRLSSLFLMLSFFFFSLFFVLIFCLSFSFMSVIYFSLVFLLSPFVPSFIFFLLLLWDRLWAFSSPISLGVLISYSIFHMCAHCTTCKYVPFVSISVSLDTVIIQYILSLPISLFHLKSGCTVHFVWYLFIPWSPYISG